MAVSGLGMRNESDFARRPRGRERGILGRRMAGRKVWRGDSRASPVFAEGWFPYNLSSLQKPSSMPLASSQTFIHSYTFILLHF